MPLKNSCVTTILGDKFVLVHHRAHRDGEVEKVRRYIFAWPDTQRITRIGHVLRHDMKPVVDVRYGVAEFGPKIIQGTE